MVGDVGKLQENIMPRPEAHELFIRAETANCSETKPTLPAWSEFYGRGVSHHGRSWGAGYS